MTDAILLQAYVDEASQAAFAELVDRHGGLVHAAARRLAADDADDVAQAVFLLLARRARRLLGRRDLAGWLYQTTRGCAANARRSRGRRAALTRAAAVEAAVRQTNHPPTDAALDHLDDGLARLSDGYRQVLLLRYMEDLTVDQTADRLGLTAAAVMKRSTRGLAKLRDFFGRRRLAVATEQGVASCLVAQATPLAGGSRAGLVATGGGAASSKVTALARAAAPPSIVVPAAVAFALAVATAAVPVGRRLLGPAARPPALPVGSVTSAVPVTRPAPPFDYEPAVSCWMATWRDSVSTDEPTTRPADVDRVATSFDRSAADVAGFADALRGSDLAVADADVRTVRDEFGRLRDGLRRGGSAGLTAASRAVRADPRTAATWQRLDAAGDQAVARADVWREAHPAGPRPPTAGPNRTVWFPGRADSLTIPGPLSVPPWLRQTAAFRQWQYRHDVRTFTTRDDAGNTYVVNAMGAVRQADGTVQEFIGDVRQTRPDGTPAATTQWFPGMRLIGWSTMDATGTHKVWDVGCGGTRGDGSTGIQLLTRFESGGRKRLYQVGPGDVIFSEWTEDAGGRHQRYLIVQGKPVEPNGW